MNKKLFLGLVMVPTCLLMVAMVLFVLKNESTGELVELTTAVSADAAQTNGSYNTTLNTSQNQVLAATTQPQNNSGLVDARHRFRAITTSKIFNNELQIYLSEQSHIENNKIVITADKIGDQYISGKVESKLAFKYGEFVFKINLLKGKGLFPAIWMLPVDGEMFPEIDIFEQIGSEERKFYGVLHYMKNNKQINQNFNYILKKNESTQNIIIDFKWTPTSMIWKINGKVVHKITKDVPKVPAYMIINLAVGGNWPGDPDKNTKIPATFNVEVLKFAPKEIYPR